MRLTQQLEALQGICRQHGVVLPTHYTTTPEIESAVQRHVTHRAEAFTVVPNDMKRYQGNALTYLDPWLTSRASERSLSGCEVDIKALLSRYPARVDFGEKMKEHHFYLMATQAFLNTGSYGATPKIVLEARAEWEALEMADPYTFRTSILPFRLRGVQNKLAHFVRAHPADLHMMLNANTATSTVLKSLPWEAGDVLLLLSCDYDATKLAASYLSDVYGVESVYIDIVLPLSDNQILQTLEKFLEHRRNSNLPLPKLANFCHVTSKTGWIFPVKRMGDLCHKFGIVVMIDGAQAPGHFPIDVVDIGCEWYIGTCHKWMFSCQGVAFLVTAPSKQAITKPLAPLTMFDESYGSAFAMSATEDYSTILSLLQAFDFVDVVCGGWQKVWRYNGELAQLAAAELAAMWKIDSENLQCVQLSQVVATGSDERRRAEVNCMPIVPLPNSTGATERRAKTLMAELLTRYKVTCFLLVGVFRNRLGDEQSMLAARVTCQIHTSVDNIRAFGQAVISALSRADLVEKSGEKNAGDAEAFALA